MVNSITLQSQIAGMFFMDPTKQISGFDLAFNSIDFVKLNTQAMSAITVTYIVWDKKTDIKTPNNTVWSSKDAIAYFSKGVDGEIVLGIDGSGTVIKFIAFDPNLSGYIPLSLARAEELCISQKQSMIDEIVAQKAFSEIVTKLGL